jgi:hypothetical protein
MQRLLSIPDVPDGEVQRRREANKGPRLLDLQKYVEATMQRSRKKFNGKVLTRTFKTDAPKCPRPAFLLFSVAKREEVKTSNPQLSFGEINERVSALWQSCGESETQKYNHSAYEDVQRYEREMEEYRVWEREMKERESGEDG